MQVLCFSLFFFFFSSLCHITTMQRKFVLLFAVGLAMSPADARLAAGLVDHEKLRRSVAASLPLRTKDANAAITPHVGNKATFWKFYRNFSQRFIV